MNIDTNETKYTVDYFLDKFEKIPEELWGIGKCFDIETKKRCAIGLCGIDFIYLGGNEQGDGLIGLFANNQHILGTIYVSRINDFHQTMLNHRVPGETPKERILNALKMIKTANE